MTIRFSNFSPGFRRLAGFIGKAGLGTCRVLRAGFAEPPTQSNPGRDAMSGRYFGLLVHVGGSDR
jgi:hypothetical protein